MVTRPDRRGAIVIERRSAHALRYSGISRPIHIRHEVEWLDRATGARAMVTFYFGQRWLSVWVFDAQDILSGDLERALARDVRLMVTVDTFTGRFLEGEMHALPLTRRGDPVDAIGLPLDRPLTIPLLGPVKHELPRSYRPDEGEQAAIDAVLFYLYGPPEEAVDRLILGMQD